MYEYVILSIVDTIRLLEARRCYVQFEKKFTTEIIVGTSNADVDGVHTYEYVGIYCSVVRVIS